MPSYHIIAMETLFLLMISKKLSLASTMYLTPVLSLLESYQNDKKEDTNQSG